MNTLPKKSPTAAPKSGTPTENPDRAAHKNPHKNLDSLTSANIRDLHSHAGHLLKHERRSHTLSPTALVNEVFVRLARQRKRTWSNQQGFLAAAGLMMKRVLSNHGRDRKALKRGGMQAKIILPLDQIETKSGGNPPDSVRLALEKLKDRDPELAHIVELRLYRGLSCTLIAEMQGNSLRTIEREWALGRSWLQSQLAQENDP